MLAIAHIQRVRRVRRVRGGFTLIELLLSIAIGSIVAAVAFITLRFILVTSHRAHRLELENRLLRNGFLDALNDADYWTIYDDPDDSSNQALRLTDTTPTTNAEILWRQTMTYGRPFTPLNIIPTMTGAVGPGGEPLTTTTWTKTPATVDPTGMTGPDNTSLGCLTGRDQDVGFNRARAYDASDPCRWYRGDFVPSSPDDKRFGRYAGVTCEVSTPALGYISPNATKPEYRDAREPGKMDRFNGPLWACTTGPYGTVDSSAFGDGSSHVWTWNPRQIAWLHDALGSYGIRDYLPANTCVAAHCTGIFLNGTQTWVHEMLDQRLVSSTYDPDPKYNSAPFPDGAKTRQSSPFAPDNNYYLTYHENAAATPMAAGWQAFFPLVPISPWTGSTAVGLGGNIAPLNTWTPPQVVHALRYRYYAHDAQDYELQNAIYVATLGKPVMPQRPADWPSPLLLSQRYATEGRLMAQYRVRFQDAVNGKIVEIGFNALGSTLRGARQQRLKVKDPLSGSGWATFHGADPIGTQTFRSAAPNSPTLDD